MSDPRQIAECRVHDWQRDPEGEGIRAWVCAECTATCATCGTCGRASGTSLLLCGPCERHAARVLDDIDRALGHYQGQPRSHYPSPGDMRLVRVPSAADGGVQTPEDIYDAMLEWAARWTEHTGPTGQGAVDYLRGRHLWAAHNPEASDWHAYLAAMRRLRVQARRIAGLLPTRLPEPCVHCGGQVVQDWADRSWEPLSDGLSDVVRCTRCGMTWGDRSRWRFATRHHVVALPGVRPDALVTLAQARMIWPDVPAATLRSWAQRWREDGDELIERALTWWAAMQRWQAGERPWWAPEDWEGPGEAPSMTGWLPERGEDRGAALYRVGDIAALVERWADASRRGRRATGA